MKPLSPAPPFLLSVFSTQVTSLTRPQALPMGAESSLSLLQPSAQGARTPEAMGWKLVYSRPPSCTGLARQWPGESFCHPVSHSEGSWAPRTSVAQWLSRGLHGWWGLWKRGLPAHRSPTGDPVPSVGSCAPRPGLPGLCETPLPAALSSPWGGPGGLSTPEDPWLKPLLLHLWSPRGPLLPQPCQPLRGQAHCPWVSPSSTRWVLRACVWTVRHPG